MTSVLNVQTPRSPQGLKGEIFLIFSEQDRAVGEKLHESLMRQGFTVAEKPEGKEGKELQEAIKEGIDQAETVLYLGSADARLSDLCQEELALALATNKRIVPIILEAVPSKAGLVPALLPAIDFTHYRNETDYGRSLEQLVREIRLGGPAITGKKPAIAESAASVARYPKTRTAATSQGLPQGISRQLTIWRSLFAAAAIGLIALLAVSGNLYQRNQSVGGDLRVAVERSDSAIAARKEMNDRLYVANVTADRALAARDRAIAQRKQMNNELYVANVTTDRALAAKDRAIAQRKQMNDRLYVANVKADKAIEGEREAQDRIEELQIELDHSKQRVNLLEGLLLKQSSNQSQDGQIRP
jgi:hypothetical protein